MDPDTQGKSPSANRNITTPQQFTDALMKIYSGFGGPAEGTREWIELQNEVNTLTTHYAAHALRESVAA